ncbi:type IX secretion system periplasmic lipoprotein PorW/SprE [Pontibacter mangrovi]|uniref:Tetratricopeptide repeat protein n=1 Tax=Pontibacter mangrovi TaxID=2589816 RepID=A0A501WE03_9BACT|nr:tetratricopeptide repeat protein [Pontibacter mangrovi]TPE45401.1 tetratricopeptide repeat protein [Pontibacter mangrovi]
MNKKPLHIFLVIAVMLLAGCSAERNNPLSKAYHNTTARYNGYFLAKEKMRLLQEQLQQQTVYDYSQVLPIFPPLDSATANALAADLEDIKKKASFPIQYHQNSKWVDNSYVLIGQANFYSLNFDEAVRTFKYVNANGKGKAERHEALVWLMRSFIKLGEMENAQQVSEYLRKERLNKDNARELYLTRAHYYRLQGDTAQVIENLALSLPNFEEKDDESRVRYTLGQLYQLTGQDKEANKQYSKVLRNNPPFDLGFFSRLNLGQVTELAGSQDKERVEGYYQKLLKDDKNKEYRNKIYYEMAQFELRQQNYEKALEYLNQSLRTPGALPNQNAYSYVAAGEIYFEKLNKYEMAAAYYDSAVQVYPQQAALYEAVVERRNVLADFAQQYTTIQTQDSLQRIAKMPETERMAFLQQLAQREEEERQAQLAQQQEEALQQAQASRRSTSRSNSNETFGTGNSGGVWYFDNPSAMATARAEFTRRWGDRPNQDFWRTRARGEATGAQPAPVAAAPAADTTQLAEQTPEELMQAQLQAYEQNLPLSTADLQKSEKMVEEALFRLAVIYAQNLQEPEQAIATYEELLQRFPLTGHAAESYYSLYLLYGRTGNQERQQVYYKKIKQQFPATTYARLLDDEGFMAKNAADNSKVHALYDSAYVHYEEQEYAQATQLLNNITAQYPLNDIQDKVMFLDAMVAARTQKPEVLRDKLNRFKKEHKGSPLVQQADQLLATYQELEQKKQLRTEAPAPPAPKQQKAPEAPAAPNRSTEIAGATASAAKPTPALPPVPDAPAPAASAAPAPDTVQETAPDTLAAPATDTLAYQAQEDSAYYFVLIYPEDAKAFADVEQKYNKYNSTYYRNQQLAVSSSDFGAGKKMLVARAFQDPKLALSYNIKQKAPQAPIGRIRGVDFITFVISSANYRKFLQKKDAEEYLTFFKDNY